MDANEEAFGSGGLEEKELVYLIVGCAMAVLNGIGHGLREKTYERALCVEFRHQAIAFSQQSKYPVLYRGEVVDEFIPDLVAEERVVVDAKTVPVIGDFERGQMINYLKVTGLNVGVILNFNKPKLEWIRIVLDEAR